MKRQDLTNYSDNELSLLFENNEGLYQDLIYWSRRENFQAVKEIAELYFIFTEAQLNDLQDTFETEVNEYNN
jgi:hypothetical protein